MPTKKQYQTRLAPDTADSVDEYADRHDVTSAEALRRLVKAGLDTEQDDTLDPEEIRADLREIRQAIEDEAVDEDETDELVEDGTIKLHQMQGGFTPEVTGALLAAIVSFVFAATMFGPVAAGVIGALALAGAVYVVTVSISRLLREVAA